MAYQTNIVFHLGRFFIKLASENLTNILCVKVKKGLRLQTFLLIVLNRSFVNVLLRTTSSIALTELHTSNRVNCTMCILYVSCNLNVVCNISSLCGEQKLFKNFEFACLPFHSCFETNIIILGCAQIELLYYIMHYIFLLLYH